MNKASGSSRRATTCGSIRIHRARTHNLQNLSVDVPRNQLVVVTGRSGSGKSSLAFGTLYAEGQRQYLESLAPESRQFFRQVPRPDVDLIEGLPPTLSFEQYAGFAHRRSTVGTLSEIHTFLKVLFARAGTAHCPQCDSVIEQHHEDQIVRRLMELPEGAKLMVLSPVPMEDGWRNALDTIRRERLVRVRVDGKVHDIDEVSESPSPVPSHLDAVTDRIIVRAGAEERILEAITLARKLGDGRIITVHRHRTGNDASASEWEEQIFTLDARCPDCGYQLAPMEPRLFSFNSPHGACPSCEGIGTLESFDPELVVVDPTKSLEDRAIGPWADLSAAQYRKKLRGLLPLIEHLEIDPRQPWSSLSESNRKSLLFTGKKKKPGLMALLHKEWSTELDESRREKLEAFVRRYRCPDCGGSRLNRIANSVRLFHHPLGRWNAMTIDQLASFLDEADIRSLPADHAAVAERLLKSIRCRLQFLQQTGAGYLSLGRSTATLSGGELQRVRLAKSLGTSLTGVCYVLDEPTVGLHPRDTQRLLQSLRQLQKAGNTVVVVEHDQAVIREADRIIDVGPGAGSQGGRLVVDGTVDDVVTCPDSLTGQYLRRHQKAAVAKPAYDHGQHRDWLVVHGATGHNLKDVTARFPLGQLIAVTGVSGSGKSTLVNETLYPSLSRTMGRIAPEPAPFRDIEGMEAIEQIYLVDQRPIGRTPRACAATYAGILTPLRKIFAATQLARQRGYNAARFSFNQKPGACAECAGKGVRTLKMNFLRDLEIQCEACHGRRYNPATLQVLFRGHSIADYLRMPIEEARKELENIEDIRRILDRLVQVGLGHLSLGQPATTLSGGEAQRIKLASELARPASGHTLFLLDEPTTGLHPADTEGLLAVLRGLVNQGNTVVVIEHQPDFIASADWVIDLGPGGGADGGNLVAEGPPHLIAASPDSVTGSFLPG